MKKLILVCFLIIPFFAWGEEPQGSGSDWNYILAQWYQEQGHYSTAVEYYEMVISKADSLKGGFDEKYLCYKSIGDCYLNINNTKRAIANYEKAGKLFDKISGANQIDCVTMLSVLSDAYLSVGENEKAKDLVNLLISIIPNLPKEYSPLFFSTVGNYHYGKGDYVKAIEFLYQHYQICISKNDISESSFSYLAKLADSYYYNGELDKAIGHYSYLFSEINWSMPSDIFLSPSFDNYAQCVFLLEHSGRTGNIINSLFNKRKSLLLDNLANLSENQRKALYESFSYNTSDYLDYFDADYSVIGQVLFDSALLKKGLLLNLSVETRKLISSSHDPELIEMYKRLQSLQLSIESFSTRDGNQRQLSAMTDQMESLEKKIASKISQKYDITKKMSITHSEVQDQLKPNEVAIEFIDYYRNGDRHYAAVLLKKDNPFPSVIRICSESELELHNYDNLNSYNSSELSSMIWHQLLEAANITPGGKIYFSPVGSFHKFGIEYLLDEDGQRMNDKYQMVRLSSTREICFQLTQSKKRTAVLYGGLQYKDESAYLHFTKDEVNNISSILKSSSYPFNVYSGKAGDERSFKELSGGDYSIIHLATHGFFSERKIRKIQKIYTPVIFRGQNTLSNDGSFTLSSKAGLMFSDYSQSSFSSINKNTNDGILTDNEISYLDFTTTELVVLSACQTALVQTGGDEIFGLQRGFKKAGVKSLIMSLCKVNDLTTDLLMTGFYRYLMKGMDKRAAFTMAQKDLRRNYPDPIYWAAFIILD